MHRAKNFKFRSIRDRQTERFLFSVPYFPWDYLTPFSFRIFQRKTESYANSCRPVITILLNNMDWKSERFSNFHFLCNAFICNVVPRDVPASGLLVDVLGLTVHGCGRDWKNFGYTVLKRPRDDGDKVNFNWTVFHNNIARLRCFASVCLDF